MNPPERKLEICCGDIDSVYAATIGGADRVELCSGLADGGLTPSAGFITAAKKICSASETKLHILIRPREGDFIYSPMEIECMLNDIHECKRLGADGVVIGALLPDGTIDMATCKSLIKAADGMTITFHRAFDLTADLSAALEQVINLGANRILTSGGAQTALEGADTLASLNRQADGRIVLLAGSGVSAENATEILKKSGVNELHASARKTVSSAMKFRNTNAKMGAPGNDEYSRKTTSADTVNKLSRIIHS